MLVALGGIVPWFLCSQVELEKRLIRQNLCYEQLEEFIEMGKLN